MKSSRRPAFLTDSPVQVWELEWWLEDKRLNIVSRTSLIDLEELQTVRTQVGNSWKHSHFLLNMRELPSLPVWTANWGQRRRSSIRPRRRRRDDSVRKRRDDQRKHGRLKTSAAPRKTAAHKVSENLLQRLVVRVRQNVLTDGKFTLYSCSKTQRKLKRYKKDK